MATKLEAMLEAEKRGILPPDKKSILDEARKRGLVPGAERVAQDSGEALLTNLPTQGLKQEIVRGLPAAALSIPGAAAGAAMGAPFGPPGMAIGGIGGAVLGGSAGEAVRQGVANVTAAAFPKENFPINQPGQVLKETGIQGAMQGAGEGVGMAAKPIIAATGRALKPVAQYVGENVAGIAKPAYEFAKKNLPEVSKMVGKGVNVANDLGNSLKQTVGDYIAGLKPKPAEADALAQTFTGGIKKAADTLRAEYPKQLDAIAQNPKYAVKNVSVTTSKLKEPGYGKKIVNEGKKFNLYTRLRNDLFSIMDEFGFDNPKTPGVAKDAAEFTSFAESITNLKQATAMEVARFVKDANYLADKYVGTPLGVAFGKFATAARTSAGKAIPEIAKANASYQAGMELLELSKKPMSANNVVQYIENVYKDPLSTKAKVALEGAVKAARDIAPEVHYSIKSIQGHIAKQALADSEEKLASKLLNANDPIAYIKKVYSAEGNTADKTALETLAKKVPEVGKLIAQIRAYTAGQAFSPGIRGLPPTGFATGVGLAGYEAYRNKDFLAQHPVAAGMVGAGALALSPRAALMALKATEPTAIQAGSKAGASAIKGASKLALSPALAALAIARKRKEKK